MRAATSGELGDYVAVLRRRWVWLVLPLLAIPLLIGIVTATSFVAALAALVLMMRLLRSVSYTPYVIYRVILGIILLIIAFS